MGESYQQPGPHQRMKIEHSSQNIHPRYKWYLLILVMLTNMFISAIPGMAMSVLSKEISQDLHLTLAQVGVIWGIGSLPMIFTSLLAGAIGDRLGPKRVLVAGCLVMGLLGAARGLAQSFAAMTAIVFLAGAFSPFINTNGIKTCGMWFPPRQLGLANGGISMGMAFGFLIGSMLSATLLSPLLGGWRNVFILYGCVGALFAIPWFFSHAAPQDHLSAGAARHISIPQALQHVARVKNIWLLGLTLFGVGGCVQSVLGYLPLYLRNIGWEPLSADGAISAFHAISLLFTLPIALWSDRLGNRKRLLFIAAGLIALGTGLLSVASGFWIWCGVLIAGFVRDGFMAIFTTMVIETEGIGYTYAGTAWGFTMAISGIGSVIAPPLGNSLADYGASVPFAFWAGLAVLGLICLSLTRSTARQEQRI
jgi:ACS family D-galactonate transporter-like MFS transporter